MVAGFETNSYVLKSALNRVALFFIPTNYTPCAGKTGRLLSVTKETSSAGTQTIADVKGGTVSLSVKTLPVPRRSTATLPLGVIKSPTG